MIAARTFWMSGLLLGAAVWMPSTARAAKPAFAEEVSIVVEGDMRVIRSNGIPNHETGQFPGRGNPNTISPQHYEFRVPANPKAAAQTTALRMQPFGVAVNGVVFDPGAAEWWNGDRNSGWQYDPIGMGPGALGLDASHAHVQPTGAYHYHGIPAALVHALTDGKQKMVIVGWAADGFPIYNNVGHTAAMDGESPLKTLASSYRVKKGQRPGGPGGAYDGKFVADYEYVAGSGDLDECNGVLGITPEYPQGIYHYMLTEQFPFIPRFYRGTPDPSFGRRPPAGAFRNQGGGPGGAGDGQGPGGGGPAGGGPGGGGPAGGGPAGGGPAGGGPAGGGPAGGPSGGYHLLPPMGAQRLNLTAEQRAQTTALEQDTKARLEKILTPEQMQKLSEMRPPGGPQPGGSQPGGSPPNP